MMYHIEAIKDTEPIPYDLLELADPSRDQIDSYISRENCYVAKHASEVLGVLVLSRIDAYAVEVKNIAVRESEQKKGIGKALLGHAERICEENGYRKLIIATGNSSLVQLSFYQKMGFEIDRLEKNYFIESYAEPIFENGIQCKHRIVLVKILSVE